MRVALAVAYAHPSNKLPCLQTIAMLAPMMVRNMSAVLTFVAVVVVFDDDDFEFRRGGNIPRRFKKYKYVPAEPICAAAVAAAAPRTPNPSGNMRIGSNIKLMTDATVLASSGIRVFPYPRNAPSETTMVSTAGAANSRVLKYDKAGLNKGESRGTPIAPRHCGPNARNVMSSTMPSVTPNPNDVWMICCFSSSFVADPTSEVVAAVVARKTLNARWKMDVHAPSAANSTAPTLPTYAVSIRLSNGSANMPTKAGSAKLRTFGDQL
mmetsp:Transcript_13593/g.38939  ORF Transcript_13593/g.38939 Transcript_13593/m.38939 type:complete len:266 (-) Transcript_13593:348-1145(-)